MMKNVRTRMQQTVLDVFPEKKNLSAAEVLTLLREHKESDINTSLPYHVRYLLTYLEMRGDLVFYPHATTYRKA